jgi:hypothetical protein
MEDMTARCAPGGYRGQVGLTGTEDTARSEHRLVKPGRRYGHGGHGIVNTFSLNRDEMAGAENTGWMPQWSIVSTVSLNRDDISAAEENPEHCLVKPRRYSGCRGELGAPSRETGTKPLEDCEHRLLKAGRRYERARRDLGE